MAIAETQVIQENKEYFASHGVDLDALESANSKDKASERSTTTLLIKNLPPDTDPDELESMFAR
jgi:RNA recognition motif-containing protein